MDDFSSDDFSGFDSNSFNMGDAGYIDTSGDTSTSDYSYLGDTSTLVDTSASDYSYSGSDYSYPDDTSASVDTSASDYSYLGDTSTSVDTADQLAAANNDYYQQNSESIGLDGTADNPPFTVDQLDPTQFSGQSNSFEDLGGGWLQDNVTGQIVDGETGNVLYSPNADGTYSTPDGTNIDLFNVKGGDSSPSNPVDDPAARIAGSGKSPSSSGGGGSGSSSSKQSGSSSGSSSSKPSNPTAGKTVIADKRIGNDRYLIFSDGSSQTLTNYYAATTGASAGTATKNAAGHPTTVASFLDSLFNTAGRVIPAVTAAKNVPSAQASAAQKAATTAAQAKIIASNAQLKTAQRGAAPAMAGIDTSGSGSSLLLLGGLALFAKFLILH